LYSWKEWSDRLSENIAEHELHEAMTSSDDYYTLWQQTLEQFIAERIKD
jgi:nitrile hydratase accessory protein